MTAHVGHIAPSGHLDLQVIRGGRLERSAVPTRELSHRDILRHGIPHSGLSPAVRDYRARNTPNLWRGWKRVIGARALGISHLYGALALLVVRGDGTREDLGLVSLRVVTTAGVGFIVDAFQNLVELEIMKYHGFGTGTGAEASSDTALGTEFTTEYAPNSTRPTGSLTEGAANVFVTAATFTPDSGGTLPVTEHGIFSQAATGGGVLLDRSKFSVVNLDTTAGDSIVSTYSLTLTAGS